jgi:hypothetical protein
MEAPMPADVVKSGLQQPSMWITSDADTWRLQHWSDRDVMQHQTMRAVFESSPGDGYFVQVPRMFHLNLTDVPLLIYAPFGRRVGLFGPIDAHRVHRTSTPTPWRSSTVISKACRQHCSMDQQRNTLKCASTRAGLNSLPPSGH